MAVVQKTTYNGATGDTYTVFKAGGKLIKNQKETLTLSDIKGTPLNLWTAAGNFVVEWNGSNFVKTQSIDCGNNGCSFGTASGNLDLTNQFELSGYSDSLGGNVRIPLVNSSNQALSLSDSSAATIYKRTTVMPGDTGIPTTLKCHDNCLSAANGTSSSSSNAINYTFNTTDMLLKQSGTPVTPNGSWNSQQPSWWMGALVDSNQSLACDWSSAQNPQTCTWKAWSLDTFYTWETGRESWNQLVLLKDRGDTVVSFAAPLQVKYTHTDGRKLRLEYNGFGNLQGVPGKCVNMVTNADASCDPTTRWVPEFNIATGATVTDGNNTGYLVKQLGIEQRMRQNVNGACSGLVLETLTLPDASTWQDPNIGDKPTVTAPPKVIGGVIQQ